jgi:hypothetical protein
MQAISSSIKPLCLLCDERFEQKNSKKILECCQNIIHSTCLEKNVKSGMFTCCFCTHPIKNIPTAIKVEGIMRKAFDKKKFEEEGNRSLIVRSMYNALEEDLSPEDQLDDFISAILYLNESLPYKQQLWKEFITQIKNPSSYVNLDDHLNLNYAELENMNAQDKINFKKKQLEFQIDDYIEQEHINTIYNLFIEGPFPISQDLLKATAEALTNIPISDALKKNAWDLFWQPYRQDPENRSYIDQFTTTKQDQFPYLSDTGWTTVKKGGKPK